MTIDDLISYYVNSYQFKKKTGMCDVSFRYWKKKGYIPESAQLKIERLTEGALKAEIKDRTIKKKPGRCTCGYYE